MWKLTLLLLAAGAIQAQTKTTTVPVTIQVPTTIGPQGPQGVPGPAGPVGPIGPAGKSTIAAPNPCSAPLSSTAIVSPDCKFNFKSSLYVWGTQKLTNGTAPPITVPAGMLACWISVAGRTTTVPSYSLSGTSLTLIGGPTDMLSYLCFGASQ